MRRAVTFVFAALFASAKCDGYKPLVASEALQDLISLEDLLSGSQQLQDIADANGGNRAFGGPGHNATVDFIYDSLTSLDYYDVYRQPFVELFTAATVRFTADGDELAAEYMTYGPSGNVSAPLVAVNNLGCTSTDFPSNVTGNIALISRGECTFAIKATNAKEAGATGAVIYNNVPGTISGTLGGVGDYPPTVGITQDLGASLLSQVRAGGITASLGVQSIQENRTTYNVIAETKGGDHSNVLVLGAHTDSVFGGPGINDDGSGTIAILRVAEALTNFAVTNAVRFAFWSAEEFGLLGSKHYVKSINGTLGGNATEIGKVRAYLNFDMIASPNYVLGIYDGDGSSFNLSGPTGSANIEKDFQDYFTSQDLPFVASIFSGRSDYAAFLENGIPSGGLFTGAEVVKTEAEAALFGGQAGVAYDVNYHQKGDTIENLNHDAYLWNARSIANSVAKYAIGWEGIPKANHTLRRRSAERHALLARGTGGHEHAPGVSCGQGSHVL